VGDGVILLEEQIRFRTLKHCIVLSSVRIKTVIGERGRVRVLGL
jgi:hypothetical protein